MEHGFVIRRQLLRPWYLQEKQRARQEQVIELSEHVQELECRQQTLKRALEAMEQV